MTPISPKKPISRLPNGVAERAISAHLAEHKYATTKELHDAVVKRARRKVQYVTTSQALARMKTQGTVILLRHGVWSRFKSNVTKLSAVCTGRPIWEAVAKVFDAKGDPFMRLEDLLQRVKLYPQDDTMRALKAMARKEILELEPYSHWAEGKEGRGVGLLMRYWRPDQLPEIKPEAAPPTPMEYLLS